MTQADIAPERARPKIDAAQQEKMKRGRYALGRLKTGVMNKVEQQYAQYLEQLQVVGGIAWHKFEGVKFRLADNTFYVPDFLVMMPDGQLQAHEVKGFWQDDARAKIKIAADMYPLKFIAVKARAKKLGGGWEVEEF